MLSYRAHRHKPIASNLTFRRKNYDSAMALSIFIFSGFFTVSMKSTTKVTKNESIKKTVVESFIVIPEKVSDLYPLPQVVDLMSPQTAMGHTTPLPPPIPTKV